MVLPYQTIICQWGNNEVWRWPQGRCSRGDSDSRVRDYHHSLCEIVVGLIIQCPSEWNFIDIVLVREWDRIQRHEIFGMRRESCLIVSNDSAYDARVVQSYPTTWDILKGCDQVLRFRWNSPYPLILLEKKIELNFRY